MKDRFGRTIEYMRISITDRCNLRCQYCMPDGITTTSMNEILTFEEIHRIVKIVTKLGIKYIKITGGEPLVRLGCIDLIRTLKNTKSIEKVTLTTNGVLLNKYADELIDAKIDAINISIDTLNSQLYHYITGFNELNNVLEAIKKFTKYNIPIKINAVSLDLKALANQQHIEIDENEWLKLLIIAREYPIDVRYIEMMPIGYGKKFKTINHEDLIQQIKSIYPSMTKDNKQHGYGPAIYYNIDGFKGSVGFISAIHGKFCNSCNRVRLTSQGYLKTCLCYDTGSDLKKLLRNNYSDDEIKEVIEKCIYQKPKAHCFENIDEITELNDMVSIGG